MPVFEALSFDILFEISTYLDLDDIAHLTQTCRQLWTLLDTNALPRRVVEANHAYTDEARQARQGTITYREAFCAIYDRRYAFSNAQPFSARVVGQGSSFLYRQGVLCVMKDDTVIVSNLRSGTPAVELDILRLSESKDSHMSGDSYEMLYYSDGILAIYVANSNEDGSLVKFIRTADNLCDYERSAGFVVLGRYTSKLFVRHTAQYACLGTHTGEGSDGHRKWVIQTYNMGSIRNNIETGSEEINHLLLEDFHGNDIGSTVAFEIHEGYFHAVSNQGTYEVEEVDWTSFYHSVRIPLDNPIEEAMQRDTRVYRRQHAEGAIHDSWTNLNLQHDERTNDLYIVESRREWVGASSKQARTFYTSRISFPTPAFTDSSWNVDSSRNDIALPLPLPDNDILTTVLESSHSANYMPTPKLYSWMRHPECPATVSLLPSPRSFILARTKFRAYNFSCSAFLDLVEDERCCPDRPPGALPCLRLRIGSRRTAPNVYNPFDYKDGSTVAKYSFTPNSPRSEPSHFEDDTQYRYTPIRMWPPPPSTCPCSNRLHCIMNPDIRPDLGMSSGQKTITAACDERSILYMVKPSHSYQYHNTKANGIDHAPGTIVLVDFGRTSTRDSSHICTGGRRWDWTPDQQKRCKEGTCSQPSAWGYT